MDLKVDQKAIRSNTLTNGDVKSYAEMTGDHNPLHFDAGFAPKVQGTGGAGTADLGDTERAGGHGYAWPWR